MNIIASCWIILTYKRKVLLKRFETKTITPNQNNWSFLECTYTSKESVEQMILRKIEEETTLSLPCVKLISTQTDKQFKNYFYSGELTDKNVNEIKRHEGELLSFFTLEEAKKLSLSNPSKDFLLSSDTLIKDTFAPVKQFTGTYIFNT